MTALHSSVDPRLRVWGWICTYARFHVFLHAYDSAQGLRTSRRDALKDTYIQRQHFLHWINNSFDLFWADWSHNQGPKRGTNQVESWTLSRSSKHAPRHTASGPFCLIKRTLHLARGHRGLLSGEMAAPEKGNIVSVPLSWFHNMHVCDRDNVRPFLSLDFAATPPVKTLYINSVTLAVRGSHTRDYTHICTDVFSNI